MSEKKERAKHREEMEARRHKENHTVVHGEEEIKASGEDKVVRDARDFWGRNSRMIIYTCAALIVLGLSYLGYKHLYKEPQEQKANEAIWRAQQFYAQDSINLALNGNGQTAGFLKIIRNYGGTKAGNLAKFYAGISYLKQGDFNNAVKYLKDFNTDAREVQAIAYARLGDAYSELNKNTEAVEMYVKAAGHFPEQQYLSADCLYRAAMRSELNGKKDDAIKYYKELATKYSSMDKGMAAEKYLARLGSIED